MLSALPSINVGRSYCPQRRQPLFCSAASVSTPTLWSSMQIDTLFLPRFIETWLSQSGASPLSIAFTLVPRKNPLPFLPRRPPKSNKHFAIILPHSRRLKNIEMTFLSWAHPSPFSGLPTDALSRLEVITLVNPEGFLSHNESPLDRIFQSSSRLRVFSSKTQSSQTFLCLNSTYSIQIHCGPSLSAWIC